MRALIFCTTCKYSADDNVGADGRSGGETLMDHARALLAADGRDDIAIKGQKCLWSCKRHCNVWLKDSNRFSYLAGDFEPTREAARAIVEWFDRHGDSRTGTVAFRHWPDGMRGHFICRMPSEAVVDDGP